MKIVITGQPKTGKTTLAHILKCEFGDQVVLAEDTIELLEVAHFPHGKSAHGKKCHQKALYYLQIELEEILSEKFPNKLMICDHGTIDYLATWPSSVESFFAEVGSSLEKEIARYHWVLQITHSKLTANFTQLDPQQYWNYHPHLFKIPIDLRFSAKVSMTSGIIKKILSGYSYEEILSNSSRKLNMGLNHGSI